MSDTAGTLASAGAAPTGPTCGNCRFGARVEINVVECRGVPPTPVAMLGQDAVGRPTMAVQLLRPRLPSSMEGCALHRPRMSAPDTGALGRLAANSAKN
jgi:hypothetical protein